MRLFFAVVLALLLGTAGAAYWWLAQPLTLLTPTVDLSIEPGMSGGEIASAVQDAGVAVNPNLLYGWFRLSGVARQIKAGSYELDPQTTPRSLLQKLVRGEESLRSVTLVEGWTFRQVQDALGRAEQLKPDSRALGAADLMAQLGKPGSPIEGQFFPNTYTYSKGSSDLAVMRRAMRAMEQAPGCGLGSARSQLASGITPRCAGFGQHRGKGNGFAQGPHAHCGRLQQPIAYWHATANRSDCHLWNGSCI